jgi:hypothetical protein
VRSSGPTKRGSIRWGRWSSPTALPASLHAVAGRPGAAARAVWLADLGRFFRRLDARTIHARTIGVELPQLRLLLDKARSTLFTAECRVTNCPMQNIRASSAGACRQGSARRKRVLDFAAHESVAQI